MSLLWGISRDMARQVREAVHCHAHVRQACMQEAMLRWQSPTVRPGVHIHACYAHLALTAQAAFVRETHALFRARHPTHGCATGVRQEAALWQPHRSFAVPRRRMSALPTDRQRILRVRQDCVLYPLRL